MILTQERVMQVLDYNKETGEFRWRVPAGRYGRIPVGSIAGSINKEGYRYIHVDGGFYRASRLAWLYVTGEWPEHQVDHQNVNPGDDRWENLREASQSNNKRNNKQYKNNSTGYKCVTWDSDRLCYTVRVTANGKRLRLGRYPTAEEAYAAYVDKLPEIHGEFANSGNST